MNDRNGEDTIPQKRSFKINVIKFIICNKKYYLCQTKEKENNTMKNKELTIEEIVNFAQKNGLDYEVYSEKFDRWGDEVIAPQTFAGIELEPHIYYWFRTFEGLKGMLLFSERYNRNTGKSIKTYRKGMRAEKIILG